MQYVSLNILSQVILVNDPQYIGTLYVYENKELANQSHITTLASVDKISWYIIFSTCSHHNIFFIFARIFVDIVLSNNLIYLTK